MTLPAKTHFSFILNDTYRQNLNSDNSKQLLYISVGFAYVENSKCEKNEVENQNRLRFMSTCKNYSHL